MENLLKKNGLKPFFLDTASILPPETTPRKTDAAALRRNTFLLRAFLKGQSLIFSLFQIAGLQFVQPDAYLIVNGMVIFRRQVIERLPLQNLRILSFCGKIFKKCSVIAPLC